MFDRDSDPMEKRHTVCIWLPLRKLNVWLPWFFIIFLFCICSRNRNVENIHKMDWTKKKKHGCHPFLQIWKLRWKYDESIEFILACCCCCCYYWNALSSSHPILFLHQYYISCNPSNFKLLFCVKFCILLTCSGFALCIFIEIVLHRFHSNIHYMYIVVSCIAVMWIHVIF